MKVFISSVRRGLEEERDALHGLIQASGHVPKRFEDYTALPVPSRQACLDGVEDCDAYLLLLGEAYGEPLPDTGKSPTEEEFVVARRRNIPILVFRKIGPEPDELQQDFIARVEEYATGRFRRSFQRTQDLLVEVVAALRDVEALPTALVWSPATDLPQVDWLFDPDRTRGYLNTSGTTLELHVLQHGAVERLALRTLESMVRSLAGLGRDLEHFGLADALDAGVKGEALIVQSSSQGPYGERGIRISRDRHVGVWETLPRDNLGVIIDPRDLEGRLSRLVALAAETNVPLGQVAVAASLGPLDFSVEGVVSDFGRRSSTTVRTGSKDAARSEPQDLVPADALSRGAREIAAEIAARLLQAYRAEPNR
ncbi:MAG TPA: DUF4062 domain-containing protein [Actinomycetota bacterium]|jgi:hypothetical protein|nr:DUF4062 domain-containing protein [Actinomycetota bacterium]